MKKISYLFALIIFLLPIKAFAHGTAEQHQQEGINSIWIYIVIASAVLLALSVAFYAYMNRKANRLNVRKKEQRDLKNRLDRSMQKVKWTGGVFLALLLVSGGFSMFSNAAGKPVTLVHVHGLGFSPNGNEILVASHNGLRVFENGAWHIPNVEKNDYMGFSATDDGFYSSGHPGEGSSLPNPFGIVKSTDGGKTLQTLDLLGESDFHNMDVGYYSHAIYVFNTGTNSKMSEPGLYYSKDGAKSWKKGAVKGIDSQLSSIAVHPKKENVIALGAKDGVYLSKDAGNTFETILSGVSVTAVAFGKDGELWGGGLRDQAILLKVDPDTGKSKTIDVPVAKDDAVSYIAEDPKSPQTIVITTFKKDIYLSHDGGDNWMKIANDGEGISLENQE